MDTMPQGDRLDRANERRTGLRCGKPEEPQRPLRRLPGSTYLIVCPACYQFLWGWKEQKGTL